MDGFKNSTKMKTGHAFSAPSKTPDHASGPRNVFATGGVVVPYKAPGRASMSAPRPIMPRPHVMPNMQKVGMPRRMAKGGPVMQGNKDGGGGPYNPPGGNSLQKANRPYSQIEVEHPRTDARPGYSKGGKKGSRKRVKKCEGGRAVGYAEGGKVGCDSEAMEGIAKRTVAKHVATKPPQGHGVKPKGNLAFMSKPMFGKG